MAASHGSKARTYVGGRDLSAYLTQASQEVEVDTADVTAFTASVKSYLSGLPDASYSAEGIWDAAGTVGSDAVIQSRWQADSTVFTHYPAGDAIGASGYGASNVFAKYSVDSPVDDANRIKLDAKASGGFGRTISLQPLTAGLTGGGTATSTYDGGAASANGGAGYLHVTELNGGTAVVKIQHSTNDSTYSDLVTFSNVTAAGSALAVPVTGTVNRYLRATWAVTGGTATIHAAFARVP